MNNTSRTGTQFSLNHLLLSMAAISIPLALLSQYWAGVNDTVDQRTIPFTEAGPLRQVLLVAGFTLTTLLLLAFLMVLVRRKLYLSVLLLCLGLTMAFFPLWRGVQTQIVNPIRGNETAAFHNDAASIAALAVARYCDRTQKWPANWDDLDTDLTAVLNEIQVGNTRGGLLANPPVSLGSNSDFSTEESQSILVRLPNLGALRPDDIRNHVDVEFKSAIASLAKESWVEFSGIKPHKPSYNTYRIEFGQLLETLSKIASTESRSEK